MTLFMKLYKREKEQRHELLNLICLIQDRLGTMSFNPTIADSNDPETIKAIVEARESLAVAQKAIEKISSTRYRRDGGAAS